MPNDEEQVSQELRSSLEKEYDVVGADWRFLIGTRFAMLAFSITLISFLLGVYRYMITAFTDVDLSGLSADQVLDLIKLRNEALRVIPVIGAVTAGLLLLVEWRTRNLYHQGCAQRAEKIEEMAISGSSPIPRFLSVLAPTLCNCKRLRAHDIHLAYIYGRVNI